MVWWVIQNLIIVAVLAAAVSLMCRGKRFSPAARHALWLVVLIKLVTPPLFVWPWEIPVPAETVTEVVSVNQDLNQAKANPLEEIEAFSLETAEVPDEEFPETDSLIIRSETFVVPLITDVEHKRKSPVVSTSVLPEIRSRMQVPQRSIWNFDRGLFWGSILWITGIFLMAFWQGLRIWKMNRLVKTAQPAPKWLSRLLEETCVLLPVSAPQIVLVRGITTPLLWAWGRPMLLWPEELSQQLSPEAKQGVLLHELAHLKRKDHWVGRLELVAGCLWWPNPLFWYVRHQLRENAELACDAWVVQTLPNGRRDYADALLTVCQNYSHPAVPLPALGMGKSTRRTLERRLTMILRDRVPFRVSWWGMIAVLLLGVLILPSWSQSTEQQPKKESSQVTEPESKDDVTDDSAEPVVETEIEEATVVEAEIDVAGEIADEPVIVVQPPEPVIAVPAPVQKPVVKEQVVLQKDIEHESDWGQLLKIDLGTPNTARNRERRRQELEKKLQALLGELRELRGKKDTEFSFTPPPKAVKPPALSQLTFELSDAANQRDRAKASLEKARATAALAVQRLKVLDFEEAKVLKNKARPAEVVESKTITLVRTTYKLTRVDAKSLEVLIRKIVKADVLQIQIADEVQSYTNAYSYAYRDNQEQPIRYIKSQFITVTTTPETQEYIGRLIALIEKAPRKEVPVRKPTTKARRSRLRQSISPQGSRKQRLEQVPVRTPEPVIPTP